MLWKSHIQRLLGRTQRRWEFCLESRLRDFFPPFIYSYYTRVSSTFVWSPALTSSVTQDSPTYWIGSSQRSKGLWIVTYFSNILTFYLFSIDTTGQMLEKNLCHHLNITLVAKMVQCLLKTFVRRLATPGFFFQMLPSL